MWQPKPAIWAPGIRQGHPLARGLKGYWPMWEGGGSLAVDQSPNRHNFTASGGTTGVATPYGLGRSFDGTDGHLQASPVPTPSGFTAAILYKPTASATGTFFGQTFASSFYWTLYRSSDDIRFYVSGSAPGDRTTFGSALTNGEWHSFVGTWAGGDTQKLFMNGVQLTPSSSASGVDTLPGDLSSYSLHVAFNTYASSYIPCQVGYCALWDTALADDAAIEQSVSPWSLITPRQRTYFWVAAAPEAETTTSTPVFLPTPHNRVEKPPMWAPGIRQGHPLARGLQAYLPLWDGGGTTAHDVSGHAAHGTLTNMAPASDWIPTAVGQGLDFDATDDLVQVTGGTFQATANAVWLLVYFKTLPNSLIGLMELGTAIKDPGPHLLLQTGNNNIRFYNQTAGYSSTASLSTNTWYSILCTMDASSCDLYVDGALKVTDSGNTSDTPNQWNIGCGWSGRSNIVLGAAARWDRKFSAGEIQQLSEDPWDLITPRQRTYFISGTAAEEPPTSVVSHVVYINRFRRVA